MTQQDMAGKTFPGLNVRDPFDEGPGIEGLRTLAALDLVATCMVAVEVRDWGRGFEVAGVAARPDRGEHLGLMCMRERVSLPGGRAEPDSTPGAGTTVRIELPVNSGSHVTLTR